MENHESSSKRNHLIIRSELTLEKYWVIEDELSNSGNLEVINEFLESLKIENRSRRTIECYRFFLRRFFREQEKLYSSLTSSEILQWFKENTQGVKERTIRFQLSVLSTFFQYCIQEEDLEKSPIKKRWFPRLPKPLPKYLEKSEISRIRHKSERDTLRNRVLVEFILASGCRVAEAQQLNREDIDIENRTARVMGKGKKIRSVHFTEHCSILLERYLNSRCDEESPLFVTSTGKRLGIRRIQIIFNKLGESAEVKGSLHPHRMRHTFATELIGKGAELSFIADELGHSHLGTTQIYARLPKANIISLYRRYMG